MTLIEEAKLRYPPGTEYRIPPSAGGVSVYTISKDDIFEDEQKMMKSGYGLDTIGIFGKGFVRHKGTWAEIISESEEKWEPKVGDWVVSLKDCEPYRKIGELFQIKDFSLHRKSIYYLDKSSKYGPTSADISTFRKAEPHEIPTDQKVMFKKGDLVVSDHPDPCWWKKGEILELGGQYWSDKDVNRLDDEIAAISKECPKGNGNTDQKGKNKLRHATPEEVAYFKKVGRGANIFYMKKEEIKPQFEVGKWYKTRMGSFVKFLKIENNTFISSEDIMYGNTKYNSTKGKFGSASDTFNFTLLTDLSEIQQYLPDGHPDKIKEKPLSLEGRYIKCLDDTCIKHYPCFKGDYLKYVISDGDKEYWGAYTKDFKVDGTNNPRYFGYQVHKKKEFELMPEGFVPPDKTIPEYVECIEIWTGNNGKESIVGKIYNTTIEEKPEFSIHSWQIVYNDSGSHFKPSTKEAYEAQNKLKEIELIVDKWYEALIFDAKYIFKPKSLNDPSRFSVYGYIYKDNKYPETPHFANVQDLENLKFADMEEVYKYFPEERPKVAEDFFIQYSPEITEDIFDKLAQKLTEIYGENYIHLNSIGEGTYKNFKSNGYLRVDKNHKGWCIDNNDQGYTNSKSVWDYVDKSPIKEQPMNTYGLKVGDVLPEKIINAWGNTGNYLTDINASFSSFGSFSGDRKIESFYDTSTGTIFKPSGCAGGTFGLKAEGFKEFMENFNKPKTVELTSLPEKWCIKVTKENAKVLGSWRTSGYGGYISTDDPRGYVYHEGYRGCKGYWEEINYPGYTEITFEQFKKWVLNDTKKELMKWSVKFCPEFTEDIFNHLIKWCDERKKLFPGTLWRGYVDDRSYSSFKKTGGVPHFNYDEEAGKDCYFCGIDNNSQCLPYISVQEMCSIIGYTKIKENWCVSSKGIKQQIIDWSKTLGLKYNFDGTAAYYGIENGQPDYHSAPWGTLLTTEQFYEKIGYIPVVQNYQFNIGDEVCVKNGKYDTEKIGYVNWRGDAEKIAGVGGDRGKIVSKFAHYGRTYYHLSCHTTGTGVLDSCLELVTPVQKQYVVGIDPYDKPQAKVTLELPVLLSTEENDGIISSSINYISSVSKKLEEETI